MTNGANGRRVDRTSSLQKRWWTVLLSVHITRVNENRIVCLALNKSMKAVLAHPQCISTLAFQTKHNRGRRLRLAREKRRWIVYLLADYLSSEHLKRGFLLIVVL